MKTPYTQIERNKILADEKIYGTVETSKRYNIQRCTLYRWKNPGKNQQYCKTQYTKNREDRLKYRKKYYEENRNNTKKVLKKSENNHGMEK